LISLCAIAKQRHPSTNSGERAAIQPPGCTLTSIWAIAKRWHPKPMNEVHELR
jgi:hypothetical protein